MTNLELAGVIRAVSFRLSQTSTHGPADEIELTDLVVAGLICFNEKYDLAWQDIFSEPEPRSIPHDD